MHRAYAARYASSCFLFSLSPYSVPPPAPTTPPIAAPLPAPLPPPAIAPPAAPTAAPTTAPTAASFTTSAVLSRSPACEVAYRLQASTAACVGTCEARPTRATGALAVPKAPLISFVSLPTRLATTSPVTSAIAMTNAMAIAVAFHGFHVAFIPCLLDGVSQFASVWRSEEHTSELQSRSDLVCRL